MTQRLWFMIFGVLVLAACNLSNVPPTPTVAPIPSATVAPIQVFPTLDATPLSNTMPNGQSCLIPPGWIPYTIEPGDSITLLAAQTDSTVEEIVAGNCLANPDQISVDQLIYLPRQPIAQ